MVTPLSTVSDRVRNALEDDPRTKNEMIEVATNLGVVTLSGTVKSDAARQAADEIARNQPGVVSVISELKIK